LKFKSNPPSVFFRPSFNHTDGFTLSALAFSAARERFSASNFIKMAASPIRRGSHRQQRAVPSAGIQH
jgi:hypothetical protein